MSSSERLRLQVSPWLALLLGAFVLLSSPALLAALLTAALVHELARQKTVILISHRLANVVPSEQIYVMEHGAVVQAGTHTALLAQGRLYGELWKSQPALEHVGKEAAP